MSEVLDGFEDFNRRVRLPLGFRIKQPARELIFFTPSGKAEFSSAQLADVVPAPGMLALGTMRSHDRGTPRSTRTTTATEAPRTCANSTS